MTNKTITSEEGVSTTTVIKSTVELPPIPQDTKSAFPLARLMSLAPSAQILLAVLLAYRYYPTIPMRDIVFCVLYPAYLLLANHLRFDSNLTIRKRPNDHPHNISVVTSEFFSGSETEWFKKYMFVFANIGLILPLITIFRAPREVAVLAAPHLFVLWCQIIGESVVMFNPYVHRFITLLVPVGFSVYRMNLLVEWFLGSVSLFNGASPTENISAWHAWGLALSSLNLIAWTYNLFVALLLRITPEYLADDKCESPEVQVISIPFIKEPVVKGTTEGTK